MSFKRKLKGIIKQSTYAKKLLKRVINTTGGNVVNIEGSNNEIKKVDCLFLKTAVKIIGENNKIIIDKDSRISSCQLNIFGNNNTIKIGEKCNLNGCNFWIEDDNNIIDMGNLTSVSGTSQLACIEGSKILIGEDCMLSSEIAIRTGDSHSIINNQNQRINPSKDVVIGKHVWIGTKCLINKGVSIGDDSIVGSGAVVTKKFQEKNIIIAGNPAIIVKSGISWNRERIR